MNIKEYLESKAESCKWVAPIEAVQDETLQRLGKFYAENPTVKSALWVPVSYTDKTGVTQHAKQYFYVTGIGTDSEEVDPFGPDYNDYTETAAEIFSTEIENYLQDLFPESPANVTVTVSDSTHKNAEATVKRIVAGEYSEAVYFITNDGSGLQHVIKG